MEHNNQVEQLLKNNTIIYKYATETKVHMIVEGNVGYIDFWPTTGRWIERGTKIEGFGARTLVKHILA